MSAFVREYFGRQDRRVLLIGGAGFDPRSAIIARELSSALNGRLGGLFIREDRPEPAPDLVVLADENCRRLEALIGGARVERVAVFGSDGTTAVGRHVVAGRHAVNLVRSLDLNGLTDIVLDFSALSIGISFPLCRALLGMAGPRRPVVNVHAMVASSPETDSRIVSVPSGFVGPVHGFQGRWGIDATVSAAKLWLPQLAVGQTKMLEDLYTVVRPDDVVPVLPFPARDPRLGDTLIEYYAREIENEWAVDARHIVYAAENDPLDFYRTVLRLDDARRPVFHSTIGSLLILSPLGSKVLALGAMLAAVERDLPVMYVEALGYETHLAGDQSQPDSAADGLVHVWLSGDVYPEANEKGGSDER